MELNYLLLLGFLFYLSIGIFLIVKNNNVSSSSRYLGLFFIALGFSPLSLYLFNISLDDSFVLPYLIFQTHMFWFYYYVNAVIGNKISKFNLYFSLTLFTLIFIIHIYSVIEISQSSSFSSQIKVLPFQVIKDGYLNSISNFYFLTRIFLTLLVCIYSLFILKKFKESG